MSTSSVHLDIPSLVEAGPLQVSARWKGICWVFLILGAATWLYGFSILPAGQVWAVYYVNLLFWMGLACGGVVTSVIFQIVRAKWSSPTRRLGESTVSFLPYAWLLFMGTWFGKEHLFPWGRGTMHGREVWLEPHFVYARFGLLFFVLFGLFTLFVRWSLRGDVGLAREQSTNKNRWTGWSFDSLTSGWKGTAAEVASIQPRMSRIAPLIIFLYAIIYSLFAFEMVMAMDPLWFSNMFGGFIFVGNVYIAWAGLAMLTIIVSYQHPSLGKQISPNVLWDNGKLVFGFCMLWGYLFFSQFLPQWYGNLPEETQWMILRTREMPWQGLSYVVFAAAFVVPFIILLSEDVKRNPVTMFAVAALVWIGVWLERYVLVMPHLSPAAIPLGLFDLIVTLGFFGGFALCVTNFLSKFPIAIISSPLASGSNRW